MVAASASTPVRRAEEPTEFSSEEIRAELSRVRRLDMDTLGRVNPELHASILQGFADIEAGRGIDAEAAMAEAWPDLE